MSVCGALCEDGLHVRSADPRHQARCLRCNAELAAGGDDGPRDLEYEARFLQEATQAAERRLGASSSGFELAVVRRLAMGQDRYGNAYLDADLPAEALEECHDLAAYCLLEAQKRLADGFDAVEAWHLFEASVYAVAADWHLRQVRHP